MPPLIRGDRNKETMPEHRRIWPLLLWGLASIAATRRIWDKGTRAVESSESVRTPYRTPYPPSDDGGEGSNRLRSATPVDPDKRPREQVENDQPIAAQVRRAKEQGRGRREKAPWQIPWAGWKDILWRVYASFNDNRLLAVAAGVVFYSLLAIFPAIAAFVSLYGLIADTSTIHFHLSLAAGIFPAGAVDILHEQITRLTAKTDAKLGLGFVTGLAIALWSANVGMKGIIDALNVVYDEKEKLDASQRIAQVIGEHDEERIHLARSDFHARAVRHLDAAKPVAGVTVDLRHQAAHGQPAGILPP